MLFSETKKAALESILFVSPDPVELDGLSEILQLDDHDTLQLVQELRAEYEKPVHGIRVLKVAGGYRFATKEEYSEEVEKILKPHTSRMSRAALETLAIIAYRQPITRAEVEKIRGVGVDRVLNRLMEKELIQEVGRKQTLGRPILYGTSTEFLEYFGLDRLEELPPLQDVTRDQIADELAQLEEDQTGKADPARGQTFLDNEAEESQALTETQSDSRDNEESEEEEES